MEDKNVGSVNANNGTECCSEWWDLHNHLTWKISYLSSSELYSNKFFFSAMRLQIFWLTVFSVCKMPRSTRSGDIPLPSPATFGYLTVVRTQGVGNLTQKALRECRIWNVPGWGGKFEPKLSSLSSGVLSSFNFCHRGDTNLNCAHTSTTHSVLEATASSWSMTVLR